MNEHTEWFQTHKEAWDRYAELVEDDGVRAEIVDGEDHGYVVRWLDEEGGAGVKY